MTARAKLARSKRDLVAQFKRLRGGFAGGGSADDRVPARPDQRPTNVSQLRSELADQFRRDVFRVFMEHGDEIIEAAHNVKSITPAELTNLLAILRVAK